MNPIRIGLFGFGCVGQGLYENLLAGPSHIQIARICVRDPHKERNAPRQLFTTDPTDILRDENINLVVELTDDADAAFRIVSKALQLGKPVVSANKKMIARNLRELIRLQVRYNTPLLYEASCCASIPIIRSLEDYYHGPWLNSLEGIVNGSTNFILSTIFETGSSFEESLREAQRLGYAESNPLLDTSGADARSKLGILMTHAFGVISREQDIACIGIHDLHESVISYAVAHQQRIKLIARTWKNGDKISAVVAPHLVNSGHRLFDVSGVFNGISARSALNNTQFFHGEGAGSHPTANAVLADIMAIGRGYRYRYGNITEPQGIGLDSDVPVKTLVFADEQFSGAELPLRVEDSHPFGSGNVLRGWTRIGDLETLHALAPGRVVLI